ncbi:nSTAND1 domain-containing NTPase [Paractinoplanes atraurantiacus]|uniref:WD40 repeat n=1 Tax=Paractinoplanes atraurantiacus TaxID=1036182 RepID=A0A285ICX0_9ACTN|nr:hypothetical protein [Actinoplanes atraurantiacus]SNY44896.1 WD40 repeat [Actinoplanes atraurantiacus]
MTVVRLSPHLYGCPFKGLQPYTEQDGDYFFGRDADRDLVTANLLASRLTVLYGPSGVGKSSLLQAGVVRHLHQLAESEFSYLAVGRAVVVYFSSWRDDPLDGLGAALQAVASPHAEPDAPGRRRLSVEMIREVSERLDADVVLLLDQAEDFITYHSGPSGDAFAALLGRVVGTPGLRASVLLGIREDALAKLDRLEAQVPGLFGNTLRLNLLDEQAARQAIEQPLNRFNETAPEGREMAVEPELVDELVPELRTGRMSVTDSGAGTAGGADTTVEAPFLQLVMTRLWAAERERASQVLTRATLAELGGAEQIVRTHLDTVMAELTGQQQEVAAGIFRHLVTPSGMKLAHTAEDLADYAGVADAAQVAEVLEQLAAGRERILRPVPPPVNQPGPPRYEIFHDVMASAALDWRRRYTAERQRLATEAELLAARAEAEAEHRRTRRRLTVSLLVSGVLAVLLVVAVAFFVQAQRSRSEAQHQAMLAEYEQTLQRDPAAGLKAALDGWDEKSTGDAEAAVRTAVEADTNRLILRGHEGTVNTAVPAPDGKSVLTAGQDGTARLFDASTGRLRRQFTAAGGSPLTGASFSPDGTLVATTAQNGQIQVYESGGRHLGRLGQASLWWGTRWITLSGRPALLVCCTDEGPATLWDARTRKQLTQYGPAAEKAWYASASPDGRQIVTTGPKGVLTIWETATGRMLARSDEFGYSSSMPEFVAGSNRVVFMNQQFDYGYYWVSFWDWRKGAGELDRRTDMRSRVIAPMAVRPDGEKVAILLDKEIDFFDARTGELENWTPQEPDWVTSATYSRDGRWLVVGGNDGRVRVWLADRMGNRPVAELLGHRGSILTVAFDRKDPWRVISASADGTARVWQLPSRTVLAGATGWVLAAGYSPDGRNIVTAEEDGHLRVYDTKGKLLKEWPVTYGNDQLNNALFTPDGDRIVSSSVGSDRPQVTMWQSGPSIPPLQQSGTLLKSLAISPDGATVAAGDANNQVIVWDLGTGRIVRRLGVANPNLSVLGVAYLPGGTTLAAAGTDGTVRLFGPGTGEPVRVLGRAGSSPLRALTVSRDGRLLLTASEDHRLHLWRLSDGSVREFDGPDSTIGGLAFNADASLLAVSAADGAVHVWRAGDLGHQLTELHRHGDAVNAVQFTPDGRGFLTASDDTTAAVYPCVSCGNFEDVRQMAERRESGRG